MSFAIRLCAPRPSVFCNVLRHHFLRGRLELLRSAVCRRCQEGWVELVLWVVRRAGHGPFTQVPPRIFLLAVNCPEVAETPRVTPTRSARTSVRACRHRRTCGCPCRCGWMMGRGTIYLLLRRIFSFPPARPRMTGGIPSSCTWGCSCTHRGWPIWRIFCGGRF